MTGEVRRVRVLLRAESLDPLGEPMGNPVWLRGVAQLSADLEALVVHWVPDETGQHCTLSNEELAP